MEKRKTKLPVLKLKKLNTRTGTEYIKNGFTLVELIVVITILAILATVGFVSFSGYLAGARDTNRIAQLKSMSDALELYRTKKDLPIPDDKIDIKIGTGTTEKTIAYQGYIGKNVLETIEYTESGLDPKDKTYFSYYLTKNKKYFQLLAFLEEENEDVVASRDVSLKHLTALKTGLSETFALDYSERNPHTQGKKLGIILSGTGSNENTPIQEIDSIKTAGELNVANTTDTYKAIIANDEVITGTGSKLATMNPKASCKRLYRAEGKRNDGIYTIDPEGNGTGFKVYCDMTTAGGGWTMIWKNFGGPGATGNISNKDLWDSTQQDMVIPVVGKGGKLASEKNSRAWEYYKNKKGKKLIKIINRNGDESEDYNLNINYVNIDLGENVVFGDIFDNNNLSSAGCIEMNNFVKVYNEGNNYGQTKYLFSLSSANVSLGLANRDNGDTCGQSNENLTYGWGTRHLFSYVHNLEWNGILALNQNFVRCQFKCWNGSEDYKTEVIWGIR